MIGQVSPFSSSNHPPPPLQKKKNGSNNLFSSQSDRHFVAQSNIRPLRGALIPYPDFPLNEEQ